MSLKGGGGSYVSKHDDSNGVYFKIMWGFLWRVFSSIFEENTFLKMHGHSNFDGGSIFLKST